jgi:hypothetical protein
MWKMKCWEASDGVLADTVLEVVVVAVLDSLDY